MIIPLDPSIERLRRNASRWTLMLVLMLFSQPAQAVVPDLSVQIERVEFGSHSIEAVELFMDGHGKARLTAEAVTGPDVQSPLRGFSLDCPGVSFDFRDLCPGGDWAFDIGPDAGQVTVTGIISSAAWTGSGLNLGSSVSAAGFDSALSLQGGEKIDARLSWLQQSVTSLAAIPGAPGQLTWFTRGHSSGEIEFSSAAIERDSGAWTAEFAIELDDLSFDSDDGRFAGEALKLNIQGGILPEHGYQASVTGRVLSGEILLDDFYRDFSDGAMDFSTQLLLSETSLDLAKLSVGDGESLLFEGRLLLPLGADERQASYEIDRLRLDFPLAYERYLEPLASIRDLDGLTVTGSVSWSGKGSGGFMRSGLLEVVDLTIVDREQGRFAVSGLNARLKPGDHEFESRLSWTGLLLKRINLGAGDIAMESEPGKVGLAEPLSLSVLGGHLVFHELAVLLPGAPPDGTGRERAEPDLAMRASLEGLDMELLTRAMDWPLFTGEISGEIPSVRLTDGVLAVDGEIVFRVFDGRLLFTALSIERPFGVLPSLAANVVAENLDLEELTRTFSFGQISGRLDGHIRDLRMLDWNPVAFDAWFGTPQDQTGSNDISRQAVNRLTTIGGGSATTALSGPILSLFKKFSYRRLGLGCRLQNNICEVRGLDDDEASVLIMEGSGIPKVMIRAFNRRMDWPQLVGGLVAVSGDGSIRIGD
jgi:hypothetical protein